MARMPIQVVIANFICYCMWFAAMGLLLPRKYPALHTVFFVLLSFFPYFFLATALSDNITVLRLLLGMGFVALTALLLYRGRWYLKLLLVFLVMVVMLLSEYLTAIIVPPEQLQSGIRSGRYEYQALWYALYLFCQALLLAGLVLVGRVLGRLHSRAAGSGQTLLFLLFPLSQLLLLAGLFLPFSRGGLLVRPQVILLAVLFCVLADLGLAAAMHFIFRAAELQARNRLLEGQISAQSAYYKALAGQYEQLRRLRHDLDNHLYTIRILIADGEPEEAARYAAALAQTEQAALLEEEEV